MARILYLLIYQSGLAGGHKMTVRHVETLRELGFDAALLIGGGSTAPIWFEHQVPMLHAASATIRPDDVVVIADDATDALLTNLKRPERAVVFAQNGYHFAGAGFATLDRFPPERFPAIIACCPSLAAMLRRGYPDASIDVVRCFADERRFAPGVKRPLIVHTPRKRPLEVRAIAGFFTKYHPRHAALPWQGLTDRTEREVAKAMGEGGLFLSLSRLEGGAMTTLEAMASGALCAGFTGIGGMDYATAENGFWVGEDDCVAAADALAQAADVLLSGGAGLKAMLEASRETARHWSHAVFKDELEQCWMRLAPEARISAGPI